MRPACVRAMLLAERSASGLYDADRIRLEDHLAECMRCSEQIARLEGLAQALHGADWSLKRRSRDAVLDRALRSRSSTQVFDVEPRRRVWLLAAAVFGVGLGTLVWLMLPTDSTPMAAHRAGLPAPDGLVPTPTAAIAPSVDPAPCAEASEGTHLRFGRAEVDVLQAARWCWRAEASLLELERGALRVQVEHADGRSFRIATKRFTVEVLGTVFEVHEEHVAVTHGTVRVVASSGGEQVALLQSGQSWSLLPVKGPASTSGTSVNERLGVARRALVAGRTKAARTRLQQLLTEPLDARRRAEVESLLAECSLADGDFDGAATAFARVASGHGGSLAGETALFSQARAELRAGRHAAAAETFRQYVARYPSGRFRKEALDHLRKLTEKP